MDGPTRTFGLITVGRVRGISVGAIADLVAAEPGALTSSNHPLLGWATRRRAWTPIAPVSPVAI